jgi:hypothetical protein
MFFREMALGTDASKFRETEVVEVWTGGAIEMRCNIQATVFGL